VRWQFRKPRALRTQEPRGPSSMQIARRDVREKRFYSHFVAAVCDRRILAASTSALIERRYRAPSTSFRSSSVIP
jgi:hypothetical protein